MNYEEEYEREYEDDYPDGIGEDDNDTLEKAKKMYHQNPEPPRWELQEYISTLHGQSDPDTARRTCEGALGKMYRELMDSGNHSGKKDDGKKNSNDGITTTVKDS